MASFDKADESCEMFPTFTACNVGAVDPGSIVGDEVVGFLVAMYLMPAEWCWIAGEFIVYRVFDIWKPFPVHRVED